ncbi:MAG: hypothetical protein ACD_42C00202G0002 [uncultured bacterium]|nr:MAG: hypothetical protein ACD_42C00202G0002 [uncultured bacterium]OGT25941.1 MAG: hypothetical protein A3B71_07825 [Gammaproteobacteria bacterium RIFCSPHIGHO2_02_FULL_42_43]OGT28628.1 MAG: hypothetical protein A2624_01560 [Gammaproteobacteria bacterium RIFCSPHIGHO2_01_FULL_42_8]OGT52325.1 MAG: hypothetical protein A3E54_01700 [Gammaproteobacteria bacterium RIFCSPHIGHO2_12_FULL_41_25]OGT61937.1 MAG: hypothetical protein A3I77_01640 [Gammaproteobacteria bacterium RIFCSPLOWO2_02_FULL_42_14]OGT
MRRGLGLRPLHYQAILDQQPELDFFEAISEDFMHFSGNDYSYLKKIAKHYPIALHGVGLSIGSTDPLNKNYLRDLKKLAKTVSAISISDHFCWTGVDGKNTHDLLPLPFTAETVEHLVSRIQTVQDYLDQRILLENVSSYVTFTENEMTEWEFIASVAEKSDCFILLDVNNIFVNAFNHGFNAQHYLQGIPRTRVKQFHLAGHKQCQTHIIDTHDASIINAVWELYREADRYFPNTPLVIERDSNIPPLEELLLEFSEL